MGSLQALLPFSASANTYNILLLRPQSVTERPTEIPIFGVHQNYFCYKFVNILLNTFLASGGEIKKQGRVTSPVIISFCFGEEHFEK